MSEPTLVGILVTELQLTSFGFVASEPCGAPPAPSLLFSLCIYPFCRSRTWRVTCFNSAHWVWDRLIGRGGQRFAESQLTQTFRIFHLDLPICCDSVVIIRNVLKERKTRGVYYFFEFLSVLIGNFFEKLHQALYTAYFDMVAVDRFLKGLKSGWTKFVFSNPECMKCNIYQSSYSRKESQW